MATVEELVKQYETDPELRKEVEKILEDGKITITEFLTFAKEHNVEEPCAMRRCDVALHKKVSSEIRYLRSISLIVTLFERHRMR